ncbi:MAG: type I restriction enzyme HsdR N-terminal domain-containing protein [Flavobacteriales bacterium]|nr:type I restriction enzyme HsdR N-terminal domain-containing protein [Flavobacteriales bacterium]
MIKLNLPAYKFTFQEDNKKTKIFDDIRKKFLVLTPEEWVRQNIIRFLVEDRKFPKNLIAIEKGLKLNGLQKRTDVLVYSKEGTPILMIECKAPEIKIDQKVFDQIGRYNINFKLPYLLVTNGLEHYCAKIDFKNRSFSFLSEIPDYEELKN